MEDSTYSKESEEILCLLLQKGANVNSVNPSDHSSQNATTATLSQIKDNLFSTNQQSKTNPILHENLSIHTLRPNLAPIFYAPNIRTLKLLLDHGAGTSILLLLNISIFWIMLNVVLC
jgi:hypothetical protein